MKLKKILIIVAIVAILAALTVTAACAATIPEKPINWEPLNNILAAITAASPVIMALLYLKWPKAAVKAAKVLAYIDVEKIKVIENAINTRTVDGSTFEEFIVRVAKERQWNWRREEINAVLTLLGPQAKRIGWVIK